MRLPNLGGRAAARLGDNPAELPNTGGRRTPEIAAVSHWTDSVGTPAPWHDAAAFVVGWTGRTR